MGQELNLEYLKNMKLTIISFILSSLLFPIVMAQPCLNYSTTTPTSQNFADWKVNKFNWYSPTNDKYYLSSERYPTMPNEIRSPYETYTQFDYMKKLAAYKPLGGENPGVRYPEDGWELIKQDFGFYKNDNNAIHS